MEGVKKDDVGDKYFQGWETVEDRGMEEDWHC